MDIPCPGVRKRYTRDPDFNLSESYGTLWDMGGLREKIAEEHARYPHPNLDEEAMKAHLIIHEMVEGQLAKRDPPEVRAVLHRLLAGGLSRHEAVHAIGTVVAQEAYRMMKSGGQLDRKRYLEALGSLTVESYRKSLGRDASTG